MEGLWATGRNTVLPVDVPAALLSCRGMAPKSALDAPGLAILLGFTFVLALNQVVVKLTGEGFQPVFMAGLRSALGVVTLGAFMLWRGIGFGVPKGARRWVFLLGFFFAYEFVCLFIALDITTVGRASILFYTMPFWAALGAHFWIAGDRLTRVKSAGLVMAFVGVALAVSAGIAGEGSLWGDLLALAGAFGWAGIALVVRATPARLLGPVQALFWQVAISAVMLLAIAPLFGPLWRDPTAFHWAGMAYQVIAVISLAFPLWFWLLTVYPPSSVTSFSFLTPVVAVLLGWLLLGEPLGWSTLAALGLVAAGLWLVNRPAAPAPATPREGREGRA